MLERLAKLDANRVGEAIAKIEVVGDAVKERVEVAVEAVKDRVDKLKADKDRCDGAGSFVSLLFKYGPTALSLRTLLYLAGRSIGVVPAPPMPAVRIEASGNPDNNEPRSGDTP